MGKSEQTITNGSKSKVRFIKLFLLAYTQWILGVRGSIFGTTIPSLQTYFDTSLGIISGMFLAYGAGGITAALFCACVYKWLDVTLLLAMAVFTFGLSFTLLLVSQNIVFAYACNVLVGIGTGATLNGVFSYANALFPDETYSFHVLAMGVSSGLVLGPLFVNPFLDIVTSDGLVRLVNCTVQDPLINSTTENTFCLNFLSSASPSIFYLYTLVGVATVPAAIAYCCIFLKERNTDCAISISSKEQFMDLDGEVPWSKLCFIGLTLTLATSTLGLGFIHGNYITTLTATGHLKLSVSKGTLLTSLFWLAFFFARLCCIGFSLIVKQATIMYVCLICSLPSVCLLILSEYQSEIYFWVGSLSFGMFCGPQFPSLMAWNREYVTLNPQLMGMFTLMDYVGMTVLPFVAGEIISWNGEVWEMYFCLCVAIYTLLGFCCAHFIGNLKLK